VLRIAASSLFAEFAAPGLIELFTGRAADLDVELNLQPPGRFEGLLRTREVDVAIGPEPRLPPADLDMIPILGYQLNLVVGPEHPLAGVQAGAAQLREQRWLLGATAAQADGLESELLRRLAVPDDGRRFYPSRAAALDAARLNRGIACAVSFAVADDLRSGRLVLVGGPVSAVPGRWTAFALPRHSRTPVAAELLRFLTTPRATQAMLRGSGRDLAHYRPSIHVTLWS
jgi:LysR family transcriptional regulator, low CO2-responsive transcriptional regulator